MYEKKWKEWKEQEVRFDSRREAQADKGTRQAEESRKEETSTARRVNRNLISLGMW
jgi:hypothetical protein